MPAGQSTGEITVDTRQLSALARQLKAADRDLRKELMKRIRLAAEPVKRAVQAEASWSTRIPAAVAVRSSYASRGAAVRVIVNAGQAPEAAPINNRDREGTFRHPVYRTRQNPDTWVSQAARPFMAKAAELSRTAVAAEVVKVYDDIARRAGFH